MDIQKERLRQSEPVLEPASDGRLPRIDQILHPVEREHGEEGRQGQCDLNMDPALFRLTDLTVGQTEHGASRRS